MVTDDPGTPGDGHWEINIASLLGAQANQLLLQVPYFDINYGLGDRIQLKVETGWVIVKNNSSATRDGAGTVLAGVKYRFYDDGPEGLTISTYPQFQFHHFLSSHDPELSEPGNQYLLPFEFAKPVGNWDINPEVGYLYSTVNASEMFYGVVFAFEKAKPWEPLFEVHANTFLDGEGTDLLLNLGFRYTFNPQMNLLASGGHTVTHSADDATQFEAYLGLQLEL